MRDTMTKNYWNPARVSIDGWKGWDITLDNRENYSIMFTCA